MSKTQSMTDVSTPETEDARIANATSKIIDLCERAEKISQAAAANVDRLFGEDNVRGGDVTESLSASSQRGEVGHLHQQIERLEWAIRSLDAVTTRFDHL